MGTTTESGTASALARYVGERPWTAFAFAACVAWLFVQLALAGDSTAKGYALLWGRMPLLVLAAWAAWRASRANRARPRAALAWGLIAAAIAVLIPADLYCGWLALVRGIEVEFSASDFLYLSYFPLMLGGLLALPRGFGGRVDRSKFALDAAIITLAGGMIVWEYTIRPSIAQAGAGFGAQMLLDLAYPLGDLTTLLAIATLLLRVPTDRARAPLYCIAGALVASLAGDAVWMMGGLPEYRGVRNLAYGLWLLQPAFVIAAAELELARPRTAEAARRWRPAFTALPLVALGLCYAMLLQVGASDPARLSAIFPGAAVLTGLVVLRQLVAQREHAALVAASVRGESEARFAALVERASDAILILDRGLSIAYASPAARRLTGGAGEGPIAPHLVPEDAEALAAFATACARAPIDRLVLPLRFGRDAPVETEASVTNLYADPRIAGLVLNVRDVSERRALESALREHRLHDALTGIANRELFLDRIRAALARGVEGAAPCAVAVFDLDRFKLVNDGLGHRIGDQVLIQLASRLVAASARADAVARLGGDEFGVLFLDAGHGEDVRGRVESLRAAIAEPLRVEQHSLRMSASAGIAFGAPGHGAEDLLRNADVALQHARAEGADTVEVFRGERHGRILERLALEVELPALLARDAFGVAFEPCIALEDGRPRALALRAAWREPQDADLDAIVAAVRETPAAVELARRLRQLAERELAALHRFLPDSESLDLLVPMDPAELRHDGCTAQVLEFAQRAGLAPSRLVLVVEQAALAALGGRALDVLSRAREAGVRLAVGGFGETHSAFELVEGFRFDRIVLAARMAGSLDAGERTATLLRAALATGRSLGLEVLAPGVDTARELSLLRELGCDLACGAAVSPPLAYERLLPWLGARLRESETA